MYAYKNGPWRNLTTHGHRNLFIYFELIRVRTHIQRNETKHTWPERINFCLLLAEKKVCFVSFFETNMYIEKEWRKEANKMKIADGKFYSRTQYNKFVVYGYGSYFLGLICFFSLHIWLCLHLFFYDIDTEKLNGKFITWWKLFIYMCYLSS